MHTRLAPIAKRHQRGDVNARLRMLSLNLKVISMPAAETPTSRGLCGEFRRTRKVGFEWLMRWRLLQTEGEGEELEFENGAGKAVDGGREQGKKMEF